MDYNAYRKKYFSDPEPEPRFRIRGVGGVSIDVADEAAAVAFYSRVLGPSAYQEEGAHGWRIGDSWLTLLAAPPGSEIPQGGVGFSIMLADAVEAERMQQAFADAGGKIRKPSDTLMYVPIKMCPVTDPFGNSILLIAPSTD